MFKIYDGREHFFQWDSDRKLIVEDAAITEVHFCNRTDNCSLVCETFVEDGITLVNVPNILLQSDWRIHVYAFDGNYTKHEKCYEVVSRTKPADYAYTETEVLTWYTINEKVEKALGQTGYYVPSVDADGNLSWEGSTELLPEVETANIKGKQGEKGEPGAPGEKGDKGEQGDPGVYVGEEAPTNPDMLVWINPTGEASSSIATKEYVDNEIATFDFIKVVDELPAEGLPNRIYLVPKADTQTQDLFDEYIWINGKWEWLTTKQVEVDLTGYVPKTAFTYDEAAETLSINI